MKKVLNVGWVVFGMMTAVFGYVIYGFISAVLAGKSLEGFGGSFAAVILFLVVGYIGSVIGNAMRLYGMPDAYFTDGTLIGNIKAKFFWQHGPQLAGFFVIYMVILRVFGNSGS